jgi:hypothetical protein
MTMKLSNYTVSLLEIQEPGDRLDPIRVIFRPVPDEQYSKGEVIVTCYDRIWTCGDRAWKTWFGNMGGESLQDFVRTCNPGYLANRLAESAGSRPDGKRRERDEEYLLKIVKAIQSALTEQHAAKPAEAVDPPSLLGCHAGKDGDCTHRQCPQLRDGEPSATGRHCPLDA